jgi:RND family efflux transporter MFP subunit
MMTLAATPIRRSTDFVATVKSRRTTTIQPQVEGFLTKILVTSGQRVPAGTVLFEVDSTPQAAAVAALESRRAALEADAMFARQQADRARQLLDAGATSQRDYEQAVAQLKNADAQVAALQDQIRQQQAELAYYRVTTSTAGIVGDVPVRVGDRVTRSTMLTTVDDNTGLEVYIQVPVQQAPVLRAGLPVEILDSAGVVMATERLSYVAASVDEATQTVLAKAPISARGGALRSDQFVRVRVIFAEEPALTVPVVSVLRISGQQFVYVAEPGEGGALVARLRGVSLGAMLTSSYVVLSGVSEGDRLITSGIQKIGDGVPVQDAQASPPGGRGGDAGGGSGGGR